MKKTLIALVALAGTALGITQSSLATGNTTAKKSLVVTSSITLGNLTTIAKTTGTNTALLGIQTGASNKWSIGVGTYTGSIVLREWDVLAGQTITNTGNKFTWIDAAGTAIEEPVLNTIFPIENAIGAAITLGYTTSRVDGSTATSTTDGITTYGNQGLAVVFSVKYEDGSITSIYGINSNKYNSNTHTPTVYFDSDLLSTPVVSESSTPWTRATLVSANEAAIIPEPTTATLSLLAFAGLAARRRRK